MKRFLCFFENLKPINVMEETIAIVTQKGALSKGLQQNTIVNLFKLTNDNVTGVENGNMDEVSVKSFSLLLALK